jgi:hypothetical protein
VLAGQTKTIRLAWSERATVGSRTIMTFNVRSLTVNGPRWTVDASFRNTSRSTRGSAGTTSRAGRYPVDRASSGSPTTSPG